VSVELRLRPAGRPGALDEDGGERGGYLGGCGAPDGAGERFVWGEAVGGDVAEEEEFAVGGVVSNEEG